MRSHLWRALLGVMAAASISAATNDDGALVFVTSFRAGKDGAIEAFRLSPKTGGIKRIGRAADVENSYFMTVSPDKKYLYAIHAKEFGSKEDEAVAGFELVGRTGKLKPLNRQSTEGSASCYLHVDSTRQALLVANYMNGTVASLPLHKDGSLGKAVSRIQHRGLSGPAESQDQPHAHCIVTSPDNRFACAADLGLDQVLVYYFDPARAHLSLNTNLTGRTPAGSGPRHLAFHPGGKYLYAINELGGSITCFEYDPQSGALAARQTIATLPNGFKGKNACADVKISPSGRFLYGTNRGHDSIAAFRIEADGRLALVEIVSSQGQEPQNLALVPDGNLLLCANMGGNNIAVFRIQPETGRLEVAGSPVAMPSPSCIQVLY